MIADGKNPSFLIIEKSQPHPAFQLLAPGDQFVQLRELLGGVPARLLHLGDEKIEPLAHVGRNLLILSPLMKSEQRHQPGDAFDGNGAQRKGSPERVPSGFVRRFA